MGCHLGLDSHLHLFLSGLEMLLRVPADNLAENFGFISLFLSKMNQFFYNLLQVETLHDFEAANSDELTLQRGDVVLVVPSDSEADQVKDKGRKYHGLCWFLLRVRWAQ